VPSTQYGSHVLLKCTHDSLSTSFLFSKIRCLKLIMGGIPRWWLEGGSRKHASYSEILERRWRHTLQAKPLRKGKTLTPPHPPACAEHLHFMLNGDTRRAPRVQVAHAQMAWEDVDKGSYVLCSTSTDNPGPDQHSPLDRLTSTWRKKRN
jgi:hypothetical protein